MQTAQNEQQSTGVTGVVGAAAGTSQQTPAAAGVSYQDYKLCLLYTSDAADD